MLLKPRKRYDILYWDTSQVESIILSLDMPAANSGKNECTCGPGMVPDTINDLCYNHLNKAVLPL